MGDMLRRKTAHAPTVRLALLSISQDAGKALLLRLFEGTPRLRVALPSSPQELFLGEHFDT